MSKLEKSKTEKEKLKSKYTKKKLSKTATYNDIREKYSDSLRQGKT